jgi:hypothetical protein
MLGYLLILLVAFYVDFLDAWNIEWNERVIGEWRIGKDVEGSGHDLILRYYSGIRL